MILEAKKQHYQIGLLQQSNTQICLQAKARVQSGKIHITSGWRCNLLGKHRAASPMILLK